jgi:hypothetical protein
MFKKLASKTLLCGALAGFGLLAALPPAEAATARVRFTPPYGNPFPDLEWFGEAVIDDGGCAATGTVLNLGGACDGDLSFVSATLNFSDVTSPSTILASYSLTGSYVAAIQRTSTDPADWTAVYSAPFSPVKGTIDQTKYNGTDQAWFSLIFVGGYAQLIWFDENPGNALVQPVPTAPYINWLPALNYASCYLTGTNTNLSWRDDCGISSNLDSKGATLNVTAVPEPSTYAMMFAGLAALVFVARRRSRQS